MRGSHRADPVGDARSGRQHGQARRPRQPRGRLGGEHRRLLVPDVDDRHWRIGRHSAVVEREHVPARQREHGGDAVLRAAATACAPPCAGCLSALMAATLPAGRPPRQCPLCAGSGPAGRAARGGCDDGWVPTLTDLASRAGIRGPDLDWLHALISDWQLLADLSFADLVLWAPLRGDEDRRADGGRVAGRAKLDGARWPRCARRQRPTALPDDIVGTVRPGAEQPSARGRVPGAAGLPGRRPGVD